MVFLLSIFAVHVFLNSICRVNGFEVNAETGEMMLFDFTNNARTSDWIEQSDVVREPGMSKAVLAIQQTRVFRRAILFTLLNPQPNGACFAGVRLLKNMNLNDYNTISLRIRAQGENNKYKIVLRHKNHDDEPYPTYENFFTAPTKDFDVVSLSLSDFKPYYRGKILNDTEPLDKTMITSFGIQIYGGVYLPIKQSGASSLEIDWIKAIQ